MMQREERENPGYYSAMSFLFFLFFYFLFIIYTYSYFIF